MSTFLYKTGDECIDITGGFISSPYTLAGTSVTVIKNSDNMQLNPNGTGRHTTLSHNTAINLTKYKSIYFDIEVVSTLGGNQWPRLGLSVNNNQNDYGVGEVTIENTIGRKLYHIDLTDKTDLAFVKAHINCGTGAVSPFMNIKIYNIWLEENLEKLPVSTDLSSAIQCNENINSKISNLKIKLENNLIQKGVQCSKTDKMSSLIDKVNNISLESLGGKKWATGTVNNSNFNQSLSLSLLSSGTVSVNKATLTGLGFKPSIVIMVNANLTQNQDDGHKHFSISYSYGNGGTIFGVSSTSSSFQGRLYRSSYSKLSFDSFELIKYSMTMNGECNWYAFE